MRITNWILIGLLMTSFVNTVFALEYYIVQDADGKISISESKPTDNKVVIKGPFARKADAESAIKNMFSGGTPATSQVTSEINDQRKSGTDVSRPAPSKP
jgi:hypothetical protein